ncbi:hypothetical protein C3V36_01310 [Lachnospiraceae bacterium oral taxon 500]|nr:hypothetical protein C3V36_01310 [Lachnospiraceae bacterium oral taxon 500]
MTKNILKKEFKNQKTPFFRWAVFIFGLFLFSFAVQAQAPAQTTESPAPATVTESSAENSETSQPGVSENSAASAEEKENTAETPAQPEPKGSPELPAELQSVLNNFLASPYMPVDILVGDWYLRNETDAFEFGGTIYVPLRSILRLIPNSVLTWNQEALRADTVFTINGVERKLSFFANSKLYLDNDVLGEMPAFSLQQNRTMMVPLSFIASLLDITTTYDSLYHTVSLNCSVWAFDPAASAPRFYSHLELKDLARLIYKEAGGTSYAALHGVASVILNHIRHPYYPNTLWEVIYAVSPSGTPHYTPAHKTGFSSVIPDYASILAAKRVLRGENSIGSCIFFNTRPFKNKTIYTKINGIYFCY